MKLSERVASGEFKVIRIAINTIDRTRVNLIQQTFVFPDDEGKINNFIQSSRWTGNHINPTEKGNYRSYCVPIDNRMSWSEYNAPIGKALILYLNQLCFCPRTFEYHTEFNFYYPQEIELRVTLEGMARLADSVYGKKRLKIKHSKYASKYGTSVSDLRAMLPTPKTPVPKKKEPKRAKVITPTVSTRPSIKGNHIYIMKNKRNGYYKIGRSIQPKIREKTLQAEEPEIEMVFSRELPCNVESNLHKKYQSKRLRGEWFALSEFDVKKTVKELMKL